MKLKELVGKKVIRTAPYELGNGMVDRSFMSMKDSVIECLDVVNNIPIVKITYGKWLDYKEDVRGLNEYDDDNWIDATEAWVRINELSRIN